MWHKSFKIVCIAMALVLASCGGDNKTSGGNTFTNPGMSGGTIGGSTGSSGDVGVIFQGIKSQAPACKTGGGRIDAHFAGGRVLSGNKVTFNNVQATTLSGGVQDFYIGLSAWYDLMIVYKMPNGQFGMSISMCPYGSTLTASRGISAFDTPLGITLADYTTNGMGSITSAQKTWMQVNNPTKVFGPTTFFPVNIK